MPFFGDMLVPWRVSFLLSDGKCIASLPMNCYTLRGAYNLTNFPNCGKATLTMSACPLVDGSKFHPWILWLAESTNRNIGKKLEFLDLKPSPKINESHLVPGTILEGHEWSSNDLVSGNMLVFRGVNLMIWFLIACLFLIYGIIEISP